MCASTIETGDAIVAKAASSGLPIAEYVRRYALGRQTRLGSTRW